MNTTGKTFWLAIQPDHVRLFRLFIRANPYVLASDRIGLQPRASVVRRVSASAKCPARIAGSVVGRSHG